MDYNSKHHKIIKIKHKTTSQFSYLGIIDNNNCDNNYQYLQDCQTE